MSSKDEGKFAEKTADDYPESTPSKKKKKKKKKKTPRTPAPPRPPSPEGGDGDGYRGSGMPTVEAELSDGAGGAGSKTSSARDDDGDAGRNKSGRSGPGKPAHAGVFRSAESDEEDNIPDAASIMPAGEIDMAELMMNIRSAPGSLQEEGEPHLEKRRGGRRGMSKLNDDSDDDGGFDIPTLGGDNSSSSSSRSRREGRRDRDRGRDRDRDSSFDHEEGKQSDRAGRSKSSSSGTRNRGNESNNVPSELDDEDETTSADRAAAHAARAARSLPEAVVRAVGYHERVIQLMQRTDFDATNRQIQALITFTKSCRRTARLVEGVLSHSGVDLPNSPKSNSSNDNDRAFSFRRSSPSPKGDGRDNDAAYNPKEDAIREESKTDLQEILDDINRLDDDTDTAGSSRGRGSGSSGGRRKSKSGGRKKQEMHPKLLKMLNSTGFNIVDFLRAPVPREFGMVQFRIVGDHNDNELFVLFDYSDEPDTSNLVMTCDRAKARMLGGKRKIFDIRTDDMLLGRCERIKKGKILQFNIYSNEVSHDEGTDSVFSSPKKMKSGGRGKNSMGALRRQLGAVEISNSKDKPRGMMVLLPEMQVNPHTGEEEPVVWQPWHEKEEMLPCYHAGHFEHISFWENKKPQYDEDLGAYTLDFDGRVTMASSKNFLMVESRNIKGPVGVRFGRIEESQFVMDVGYPCSPLQGMGVALASMLTKTTG
eukprot:g4614.t1